MREEIDVATVGRPHGTTIVTGVEGQLGELASIDADYKNVEILYALVVGVEAVAHAHNPLSVGRDARRGETLILTGEDKGFDAGLVVYLPDFAYPLIVESGAKEGVGFVLYRFGSTAVGVIGKEVILAIVAPDAGVSVFLSGEEYDVGIIGRGFGGRIVGAAEGELVEHASGFGIDAVYRTGVVALFREIDILAVGRPGEVGHPVAEGALRGTASASFGAGYHDIGLFVFIGEIGYFETIG